MALLYSEICVKKTARTPLKQGMKVVDRNPIVTLLAKVSPGPFPRLFSRQDHVQLILTIYVTLGLAKDRYCPYTQASSATGSLFRRPATLPTSHDDAQHAPHRNRRQWHWCDDFATTKDLRNDYKRTAATVVATRTTASTEG